jgi:diguanylate cyclase (GGDEF)-like protein
MLSGIPGVIEVTASFGVSSFDEQSDTAEAIIRRAERALTRAKNEGRNRVES